MTTIDTLYTLYAPRLARRIDYIVNDTHLTEDLLQDTFLRAWQAICREPDKQYGYSWLYCIASHLALDEVRKRYRKATMQSLDASMDGGFDMAYVPDFLVESDIPQAFAKLTERQKEICRLFAKGYDGSEIAERYGVGKQSVYEARGRLRVHLGRLEAQEQEAA